MIANNIEALIGNTPLVRINSLSDETGTTILGKCEFMNPTSSVKDRIAMNMINKAIEAGKINKTTTIIEPTSGNTGIGLAAICASKGLKLILTMPDSMSIERQKLLTYLGAELVLTPAALGMNGSIEKAHELENELDDAKKGMVVVGEIIKNAGNSPEAKEAASNLGKTAVILTQTINNALLPLAAINYSFDKARVYFAEKFEQDLSKKAESYSSPSMTNQSPSPSLYELPKSLEIPPAKKEGFRPDL